MKSWKFVMIISLSFMLCVAADEREQKEIRDLETLKRVHPDLAGGIEAYLNDERQLELVYESVKQVYSDLEGVYGAHSSQELQGKLAAAQEKWREYQEAAVTSETAVYRSRDWYYIYKSQLTRERTVRLMQMLTDMNDLFGGAGPQECAPPANRAIETLKQSGISVPSASAR